MAGQKKQRNDSLKRKVATRRVRKTLLVFCEGEVTEKQYLNALKREPAVRSAASVDIRMHPAAGRVPMTLVDMAIAEKNRNERERGEIDEFWCLFDVEWPKNHPNLCDAVNKAVNNGIRLAVSNPCFELWLILHLEDRRAALDTDEANKRRRKLDGSKGKELERLLYMDGRLVARDRARDLRTLHDGNGTAFPRDNPSSGMHLLLDSVEPPGGA